MSLLVLISLVLLDVCVGIALWEDIWVFLPEDVAHSATGDDL